MSAAHDRSTERAPASRATIGSGGAAPEGKRSCCGALGAPGVAVVQEPVKVHLDARVAPEGDCLPTAWPASHRPPRHRRAGRPVHASVPAPVPGQRRRRSCRGPVSRHRRPAASPDASTTVPGQLWTSSEPIATEMPRPPAPPSHGDQLCPATDATVAVAASIGRSRPASAGPTAPLAMSHTPATAIGPNPATLCSAVPDTVPPPTSLRSTPARIRAAMLENGMDPANHPRAMTAMGLGRRVILRSYPPGRPSPALFGHRRRRLTSGQPVALTVGRG